MPISGPRSFCERPRSWRNSRSCAPRFPLVTYIWYLPPDRVPFQTSAGSPPVFTLRLVSLPRSSQYRGAVSPPLSPVRGISPLYLFHHGLRKRLVLGKVQLEVIQDGIDEVLLRLRQLDPVP